jgi:hypothetical protein
MFSPEEENSARGSEIDTDSVYNAWREEAFRT